MTDLVGVWDIPLNDGVHTIEFEHGTLTGKRVIRMDGKEILRKDWMFRLVGEELFTINKILCMIKIDADGLFNYSYTLTVDGKTLQSFTQNQSKICCTWLVSLPPEMYRIVLEKETLDVWINGAKEEVTAEFVDNGTEMRFNLGEYPAYIKAIPSYTKKEGIIYSLIVDDDVISPLLNGDVFLFLRNQVAVYIVENEKGHAFLDQLGHRKDS